MPNIGRYGTAAALSFIKPKVLTVRLQSLTHIFMDPTLQYLIYHNVFESDNSDETKEEGVVYDSDEIDVDLLPDWD